MAINCMSSKDDLLKLLFDLIFNIDNISLHRFNIQNNFIDITLMGSFKRELLSDGKLLTLELNISSFETKKLNTGELIKKSMEMIKKLSEIHEENK